ncbi:alpha/beta fold hydrolase [Brevibacterium antiquum]|uniref:Pimeloyl-ACP methyl ester carboxylesterase n=1 Tax=Brevibacterium antiquum TaxID=234835 RepID=A0A2H1K7M1_9MICO|nr:alpha/beta hydrolase [Brevibacterium antiquum]SMX95807.1 Pimeloyl-ACP methyl ester carboxylesterase [Brevibacterium antiquum]
MKASGAATSADGTELAWKATGTGPALIMIDPILVDRASSPISTLAEQLSEDFTVYRFDRRGKGDSTDAGASTPKREADDLAAVIDDAGLGPEPSVFGFSSGGSLALYAASRGMAMSSLAVVEPPLDLPSTAGIIAEIEALIAEGKNTEAVVRLYRYQGMPEDIIEQMTPFAEGISQNAYTMVYDLSIIEALNVESLSKIDVRTLAVASTSSPQMLRDFGNKLVRYAPAATSVELDGDWHGVPDELLAKAITEFAAPI